MSKTDEIDILGHLQDSSALEFFHEIPLPHFELFGLDLSITKHVVMIWTASALLLAVLIPVARQKNIVPGKLKNFIEVLLVFIRDEIAVNQIGHKGVYFVPLLATLFFFILFCNLLGLVPFGSTATGNLSVTAGLALVSFIAIHSAGVARHGMCGYFKHIVPPVPFWLYPLMLCVEIAGHLAKPFALAIRLFANMVGGHIVLLVIMGFIFTFKNMAIASLSVFAAVALSCLEIFVAVLQAFVFTFLTAVFIGGAVEEGHRKTLLVSITF